MVFTPTNVLIVCNYFSLSLTQYNTHSGSTHSFYVGLGLPTFEKIIDKI